MKLDFLETKQALIQYEKDGSDLTKLMTIDFFLVSKNKFSIEEISTSLKDENIDTDKLIQEFDTEANLWTCYITMTLIPNLDSVWGLEQKLERIALLHNANYDGFGSYGNI